MEGKRKAVYWSIYSAFVLIGICVSIFGRQFLSQSSGGRSGFVDALVGSAFWVCFLLAEPVATTVYRCLGLSLESRTSEILARLDHIPERVFPEVIEVRQSKALEATLTAFVTLLSLGCFVGFLLATRSETRYAALAGLTFFGFLTSVCYLTIFKPVASIDAQGVKAYDGIGLRKKSVSWSQIATFEAETIRDVLGDVVATTYALKDVHGKKLINLNLYGVPQDEQDRFIQALRSLISRHDNLS